MLRRPAQVLIKIRNQISKNYFSAFSGLSDVPRKRLRSERKCLVTEINELKRRGRVKRKERQKVCEFLLKPPENGLLVKSLIPIAHQVFNARAQLHNCVSQVLDKIYVHVCRVCGEVHVGNFPHNIRTCDIAGNLKEHNWERGGVNHILPVVESFHLYDRVGRAVSHEERLQVDRIPAILELCVQAGVDIPEYPTKRRVYPVYSISGKMIDFEVTFPGEYSSGKDIQPYGFWVKKAAVGDRDAQPLASTGSSEDIAQLGMKAWEKMRSGALTLMQKYAVQTCGFCPEVQVGPKGHRARICQAFKHQMRDGQHAWQEATFDDLVPPVYVWHVPNEHRGGPLPHELRRYYGKLPAVLELFNQAGVSVGEEYARVMREDVALPTLDEEKLVV